MSHNMWQFASSSLVTFLMRHNPTGARSESKVYVIVWRWILILKDIGENRKLEEKIGVISF